MSIICFEGNHGTGKGTLITNLKNVFDESNINYAVVRDSDYPEFDIVKNLIRSGELSDQSQIIEEVAQTRRSIYDQYIHDIIDTFDLTLFDRSYFTSAVWQSRSDDDVKRIIAANESKGIPVADLAFILTAPVAVIEDRIRSRGRVDDVKYDYDEMELFRQRYEMIAALRDECYLIDATRKPKEIASTVYRIISENNAL